MQTRSKSDAGGDSANPTASAFLQQAAAMGRAALDQAELEQLLAGLGIQSAATPLASTSAV